MDKKIEAAIRETLVIGNPVSIKRCVDKLKLIFEQEQALRQANVSGSLPSAEEIDAAIKELGKQSTAPDKETPDWLEADIRRGMAWMLNRVVGNAV